MISSSHQGWLMMFQDLGLCQSQVKGNYLFFFSAILLPLTVSHPFLFTACHWSHSFILVWCKLLSGVDSVSDLAEVLHNEHRFAEKACNFYFWNDPRHRSRQDCLLPFKRGLKSRTWAMGTIIFLVVKLHLFNPFKNKQTRKLLWPLPWHKDSDLKCVLHF